MQRTKSSNVLFLCLLTITSVSILGQCHWLAIKCDMRIVLLLFMGNRRHLTTRYRTMSTFASNDWWVFQRVFHKLMLHLIWLKLIFKNNIIWRQFISFVNLVSKWDRNTVFIFILNDTTKSICVNQIWFTTFWTFFMGEHNILLTFMITKFFNNCCWFPENIFFMSHNWMVQNNYNQK